MEEERPVSLDSLTKLRAFQNSVVLHLRNLAREDIERWDSAVLPAECHLWHYDRTADHHQHISVGLESAAQLTEQFLNEYAEQYSKFMGESIGWTARKARESWSRLSEDNDNLFSAEGINRPKESTAKDDGESKDESENTADDESILERLERSYKAVHERYTVLEPTPELTVTISREMLNLFEGLCTMIEEINQDESAIVD